MSGLSPLGVPPGAAIAKLAAALTLAGAAEDLGQVLCGDVVQQVLVVVGAQEVDLVDGDGVQPALDDAEDG